MRQTQIEEHSRKKWIVLLEKVKIIKDKIIQINRKTEKLFPIKGY